MNEASLRPALSKLMNTAYVFVARARSRSVESAFVFSVLCTLRILLLGQHSSKRHQRREGCLLDEQDGRHAEPGVPECRLHVP